MGPPVAFADWDDFKHLPKRPNLDSSGGDTSGAVERYLLGKLEEVKLQPECGQRHVVRLPENTSDLCVQRLITACPGAPAGPPACTPPSSGVVHCSSTTGTSGTSQPPSTTAAWTGFRVATAARARIHSASPDQTSALFMLVTAASMCSWGQ